MMRRIAECERVIKLVERMEEKHTFLLMTIDKEPPLLLISSFK